MVNKRYKKSLSEAIKASKNGYNVSIKYLTEKLQVSDRWIKDKLLQKINYVVYELHGRDYIEFSKIKDAQNNNFSNGTYFNKDEINKFIINECQIEIQTEIIDLYSYLEGNPKQRSNIYKMYCDNYKESEIGFGRMPKCVINAINKNYYKDKIFNLSVKSGTFKDKKTGDIYKNLKSGRSDLRCPGKPYPDKENIDIFKDEIYFPKKDFEIDGKVIKAGEQIYRYAYIHGDIKVKIGSGKTIFIKNKRNYSKYKMPFTIPFNMKMSKY